MKKPKVKKPKNPANFRTALAEFAATLTTKWESLLDFQPEDQLKAPVASLLATVGSLTAIDVDSVTEVQEWEKRGRPDIGVTVEKLLCGHVELKAPGKGADPTKFKGADKLQWEKFKNLPNLVYSDGNQWALYRTGERIGKLVRLAGNVTEDGEDAVTDKNASDLLALCQNFILWKPQVPSGSQALATLLAPLCRLLRDEVLTSLEDEASPLSALAVDWRAYLFPSATDEEFADAYAQTLTYALLLAKVSGAVSLSIPNAAKAIRGGHKLLADTLKVLGDDSAREYLEVPISLLDRVISAIDVEALTKKSKGDVWLYFYEDFLSEYDPKMRADRGVFYTPVEVVQCQVRLVSELLEKKFKKPAGFVDPKVVTLDPAAGTGTYILAAAKHSLDALVKKKGKGMRASGATTAAKNLHAFELLVGPYAVAHLRLTQQILSDGGTLPADGVHVYLTDTLESPHAVPPGHLPLAYRTLGEEHQRAQKVKLDTPIFVCIGNPPYNREEHAEGAVEQERKGGWIRFGDTESDGEGIFADFLAPLTEAGQGVHAKNLYNDYVYFWRWALWKVFEAESASGPGIISFITAASYLRGPGFAGMRQVMRERFDDLWIIDLEGGNLGSRKTENVFAIQTPVAIAVGVRYATPQPATPANVYYTKLEGTTEEKLEALSAVESFASLTFETCSSEWSVPFLPVQYTQYQNWPRLTDLFPWQENGIKAGRTWPIGPTPELLSERWSALMSATDRQKAFKDSPTGRKYDKTAPPLAGFPASEATIASSAVNAAPPPLVGYAFRSFDRQLIFADGRLLDRPSPRLWAVRSEKQVFLTSILTDVIGSGPAAVATDLIPDLHHFSGRGGKDVIPLWRDVEGAQPNISAATLERLESAYGFPVSPEDFFAYCYALLASPDYVKRFWEELNSPGLRVPITQDAELFLAAAKIGKRLVRLHTFGRRFVEDENDELIPSGTVRCLTATGNEADDYPDQFSYDPEEQRILIGAGVFDNVREEVWEFSVSGLKVVQSWLSYRLKAGAGKHSSPLDSIRPAKWEFDDEFLNLLWVIEATLSIRPLQASLLDLVLKGKVIDASDFPPPTVLEAEPPTVGNLVPDPNQVVLFGDVSP